MKIYFAIPLTKFLKSNKKSYYGWAPNKYQEWIKKIITAIELMGHKVHCPLRDDHKWGKAHPSLTFLCKKQYQKITKWCDVLIAYLGNPQSAGVAIEIGYAISHKIPVIMIKKPGEKITLIAYGLNAVNPCRIIEFKNDNDLIQKIKKELKNKK
jgi:hypothetical protein